MGSTAIEIDNVFGIFGAARSSNTCATCALTLKPFKKSVLASIRKSVSAAQRNDISALAIRRAASNETSECYATPTTLKRLKRFKAEALYCRGFIPYFPYCAASCTR